ncbi:MAG: MMPL family transporter, partial [Myxococcota bacterium]
AAAVAAGIIFILLVADFGGPRDALLALVPTGLGWLWMFGAMALLRMQFNVANIVCLPLVLGIGVAFGVHFMHRVREDEHASLDTVLRGTGGAIAIAALTTMVGFAGLVAGRYGGMQSLGLTMVVGIATCLLATVCILPAMLLVLGRLK